MLTPFYFLCISSFSVASGSSLGGERRFLHAYGHISMSVHAHGCLFIWGPKVDFRNHPRCSSTLFTEAASLNQVQGLLVELVLTSQIAVLELQRGLHAHLELTWFSRVLNSGLYTCTESGLTTWPSPQLHCSFIDVLILSCSV